MCYNVEDHRKLTTVDEILFSFYKCSVLPQFLLILYFAIAMIIKYIYHE